MATRRRTPPANKVFEPDGDGIEALAREDLPRLIEQIPFGMILCRVMYRAGEAIDVECLYANPAFHRKTGLPRVNGRKASELVPNIRKTDPWLFEVFDRVARGGEAESFERYVIGLGEWFSVRLFCPKPKHFVAVLGLASQRKRVEEAMRHRDRFFQESQEVARLGSWEVEIQDDRTTLSAEMSRLYGFPSEGPMPTWDQCMSRVHPEDRVPTQQAFAKALAERSWFEITHRVTVPKGGESYVHMIGQFLGGRKGDPHGRMVGAAQDVTGQVVSGLLLQETDRRFHSLMEALPVPSGVNDAAGNITYLNPAFTRSYGYTLLDIPRLETWWNLAYPDRHYRAEVVSEWGRRLRRMQSGGGEFEPMEVTLRTKGGDDRIVIASAVPLDSPTGEQHLVTLQDVSNLKRAELALRDSKQQLELALQGSDLALWDCEVATGRLGVNEYWRTLLGFRETDATPSMTEWLSLIHPDDKASVMEEVRAHLAGETAAYESEHRIRHRRGHWVWILARGRATEFAADGSPLRVTGTMRDISDRKRLRQEGTELLRGIEQLITAMDSRKADADRTGPSQAEDTEERLTRRQTEILRLIATGLTSAQIAARLRISQATALTHRRDLMRKLNLHSAAELTRYALRKGLLPD